MKKLWNYIDAKSWKAETKFKAACFILGILFALVGFSIWMVVRIWALETPDWMICFIGYPVLTSWNVALFYSCRHEFHSYAVQK